MVNVRALPFFEIEDEGVNFELCEAVLDVAVKTSNKDGGTKTEYRPVLDGLLLIYRFPKVCSGQTVVVPDRPWIGNKLSGWKHGERVTLEDPRFEEIYAANSDDQVEARYLLTPTFMERQVALAEHLVPAMRCHSPFRTRTSSLGMRQDD